MNEGCYNRVVNPSNTISAVFCGSRPFPLTRLSMLWMTALKFSSRAGGPMRNTETRKKNTKGLAERSRSQESPWVPKPVRNMSRGATWCLAFFLLPIFPKGDHCGAQCGTSVRDKCARDACQPDMTDPGGPDHDLITLVEHFQSLEHQRGT